MERQRMIDLVEEHLRAEGAGDVDGALAVYTDDIEHDVVGWPGGPSRGKDAARRFYDHLTANFRTEEEHPTRRWFADDAMILDQMMTGTVTGEFLGLPGHGRRITFRILHVFEFRDDLVCRENVWLDGAAVQAQLAEEPAVTAAAG
jgi:steroid delta-isomerase-like uncharacterized protein